MYRHFLIGLLCSCTASLTTSFTAYAETNPSPTPVPAVEGKRLVDQVSAEEKAKASALWNQSLEAFSARSYKSSIKLLTEYVDKYPGTLDSIDARYFLAQSHLFTKNAKAALPLLTSVIEIRGKSALGNEARTYLGQAYLDESKFTEAYLVSEELLSQESIGTTFRAKALLLRAHAQAGLKQNLEAEKTLVAFQTIAESDPELERETAGSFLVSLLLKANHCDALPSSKALPEDQVIDQISRKSLCILEMGTLLVKASKRLSEDELLVAAETVTKSLAEYSKDRETHPLAIGKKNAAKMKTARAELSEKLLEGYKSAEKLLTESFRERENLKLILQKIRSKS